jgi:hypothetical protein
MTFKCFKKIGTKNLDIDNDEIYQCAKNQSENRCILGSGKITNLPKFQTFELFTRSRSMDLSFLLSLK